MIDVPRVLALVGDESGPTLWRIWSPFAELQKRGIFAHWKHRLDPELAQPAFLNKLPFNFDAVLLPRLAWHEEADNVRWIAALHKAGLAVIVEIDDDIYSPSIVGRQYQVHEVERERGYAALERDRLAHIHVLRNADGATVSTRRLATIAEQYTEKPLRIVPNAIDVAWFRRTLRGCARVVPPLSIGWAGGARFAQDLDPVAEAWRRIARRHPDVTFVVQGYMADVLIDAVPPDRVRKLGWLPLHEYPRALLNVDIGCCSVARTLFNTAKTPIKLWEMTLAGAACVVTPTLYGQVATDGEDALVAETADEWESALSRLIESPELRRRLHRAQRRRVVCEHSLRNNWWRWPAAWTEILEDFRARRPTASSRLLIPA